MWSNVVMVQPFARPGEPMTKITEVGDLPSLVRSVAIGGSVN